MEAGVSVDEATHVKIGGRIEKIVSKWGIDKDGHLAKPSQGGFGVITESGERVSMWQAQLYLREDKQEEPTRDKKK
jgi:hypothetical protein